MLPSRYFKWVLCFLPLLFVAQTGCAKVRLVINVNSDGSGTLGMATGLNQQARALVGEQDITDQLNQQIVDEEIKENISIHRWSEGDYEWTELTSSFTDLNSLNEQMMSNELFEQFAVTRQRRLLQDRFIMEARMAALNNDVPSTDELFLDPSAILEMQIQLRLPGKIIETNGIYNPKENTLIWSMPLDEPLHMYAESVVWNWGRVTLALVLAGGGGLILLSLAGTLIFAPQLLDTRFHHYLSIIGLGNQKSTIKAEDPPTLKSNSLKTQTSLQDLEIDKLLHQVNKRLLGGNGKVSSSLTEASLSWMPSGDTQRRKILVSLVDNQTININGRNFPATHDGAIEGVKACVLYFRSRNLI